MKSTRQLLSDTGAAVKEFFNASLRLAGLAVPLTIQAGNAVISAGGRLIGTAKNADVGKTAKDLRKQARKGAKAVSKVAKEIEARRPGHRPSTAQRFRKFGIIGGAAAGVVAILVFVPRKLIERFRAQEPESAAAPSEVVMPTPAQAAGGEAHSQAPGVTDVGHTAPTRDPKVAEVGGDNRQSRSA